MKGFIQIAPILFIISIMIGSCTKYEEVSEDEKPSITYTTITPMNIKEFKDSVQITIKYKDGNGDLGDENPDVLNIYVKDNRLDKADFYHLHALSPPGKSIAIEGTLNIKLKNTFLIGSGNSETTSYEVKIKDRAGNWTNSIITEMVTITKNEQRGHHIRDVVAMCYEHKCANYL